MTASIAHRETPRLRHVLARADDALVHGHRLSEWIGHGPMLEEEMALANIGLDMIGQARSLYAHAATLDTSDHTEDSYAYLRDPAQFRNLLIFELPNGDFAQTMLRLFLTAAFADPCWRAMAASTDATLAAIAAKAEKESAYHLRHAAEWVVRLGDGTAESHARAQAALDLLWPYTGEMFDIDAHETELVAQGIAVDPAALREVWQHHVRQVLARATLSQPSDGWMQRGGRDGRHTEHLGPMLAVMQCLPRAHPGAQW